MALREFDDRQGRRWRVWDVTAEKLHPSTRAEDYMRDYLSGWLAFESVDGQAKCRLSPIPRDWEAASLEKLELWLRAAEPVRGDRTSGPTELPDAEASEHVATTADGNRPRTRTFRYPGGRYWTVSEWPVSDGKGGSRRVLRFASGSRMLDLSDFPAAWTGLPDDDLAGLLARGFPREARDESDESTPNRRSIDRNP